MKFKNGDIVMVVGAAKYSLNDFSGKIGEVLVYNKHHDDYLVGEFHKANWFFNGRSLIKIGSKCGGKVVFNITNAVAEIICGEIE